MPRRSSRKAGAHRNRGLLPRSGLTLRLAETRLPRNRRPVETPTFHAPYEPLLTANLAPGVFHGYGDPAVHMLNAVYGQVPALHPGVLGTSDNEGADALKQAVGGSLGLDVDYYVLVNLLGFRELVDAMGGVTVNINDPVPIGGNTDLGIPPDGYLEPGPDQRLDGFEALWYSRGRYGSDDYQRMERQRCMVDAIVDEADPLTLLRRYQQLAATGKEIVRTDIPAALMPAFVELCRRRGMLLAKLAWEEKGAYLGARAQLLAPPFDAHAVELAVPHVTLVHPRTSDRSAEAWAALAGIRYDVDVLIERVALIAFDGFGWPASKVVELTGPPW